ncbi:MAG: GumC family protein [Thermodesulfobacteriota bacterium]
MHPMEPDYMQEPEESIHLSDYLHILLKHKWLIAACFVTVLGIAVFISFRTEPVYQATSTMVIDYKAITSPVTGEKIDYGGFLSNQVSINTHMRLLKSRPVLEKVARGLGLNRRFDPQKTKTEDHTLGPIQAFFFNLKTYFSGLRKNFSLLLGQSEPAAVPPPDRETKLVQYLSGKLDVGQMRDTNLLTINAFDTDPIMAREIANTLAQTYIQHQASGRLQSSQDMLNWMTDQLYEVQKKLEDSETAFQAFKENEQIYSIEGKRNLISQQIQESNQGYLETRSQRLEIESKMKELKRISRQKGSMIDGRLLINNPLINELYSQVLNLEVESNRLSQVYKSKHPKMAQIQNRVEQTRGKLNDELNKEIDNLEAKLAVLKSKEEILQENMTSSEHVALQADKKEFRYAMLQRGVETNRKLYDTLLSKIEASAIDEDLDVSNIRIVEEAIIPPVPVKPDKKRNIMLGAVLGLMLGAGLAFLLEFMDRSIRSEEDVERYLGMPVLSMIPEAEKP